MIQRYKDLRTGALSEYITPDRFRTISERQRKYTPPGASEIFVEIQLKGRMRSLLSFKIPWDGIIYGCARGKREIKERLGLKSDICAAYIVDWDDKFLLMLELEGKIDYPVLFVSTEDVIGLLENCWRIPEQR